MQEEDSGRFEWKPRLKTPEELTIQERQVDLSLNADKGYGIRVPDEYKQDPQKYLDDVRRGVRLPYGQEDYLQSLRSLRRGQTERIHEELSQVPQGESRVEAYLQTVQEYSPPLGEKILERIQSNYRSTYYGEIRRSLTDQEVSEAAKNQDTFYETLYSIFDSPGGLDKFLKNIPIVEQLLPSEKIAHYLTLCSEEGSFSFVNQFGSFKKYLPSERHKELLETAIRRGGHAEIHFSSGRLGEYFSRDEARGLILTALAERRWLPDPYTLQELIDNNYLDSEEVRDLILKKINTYVSPGEISQLASFFPPEYRDELGTKVMSIVMDKETKISTIKELEEILSEEQIKKVLNHWIEQKSFWILTDELLQKYVPKQTIQNWVKEASSRESILDHAGYFVQPIIESGYLTDGEAIDLAKRNIKKFPHSLLTNDELRKFFMQNTSSSEYVTTLRNALENYPSSLLFRADEFLPFITHDPQEQKKLLEESMFHQSTGVSFIELFDKAEDDSFIKKLFTHEEIKEILFKKSELSPEGLLGGSLLALREFLGSDEELKRLTNLGREGNPYAFVSNFKQLHYLYKNETYDILRELQTTSKGMDALASFLQEWSDFADAEYVQNFLWKVLDTDSIPSVIHGIKEYLYRLPDSEKEEYKRELVKVNPPAILDVLSYDERYKEYFNKEMVTAIAQQDEERLRFAPRTLNNFYTHLEKNKDIATSTWKEAIETYFFIAKIKSNNLENEYQQAMSGEMALFTHEKQTQLTVAQEKELLSTFFCFALLKEKKPEEFKNLETLGSSIKEAKHMLFQNLCDLMDFQGEASQETENRFFSAMGSAVPFMLYYLQFESSPEHKVILEDMFKSITDVKYREWKFGELTEETLLELKQKKLIPQNLTLDQYTNWTQDEQTSLFETLSSDAENVSKSIVDIIEAEAEHLDIGRLVEFEGESEELYKDMGEDLRTLGQEIASLQKKRGEITKNGQTNEVVLQDVNAQIEELEEKRKSLTKDRYIIRLLTLRPQEVTVGRLLEGEDLQKEGKKLMQVFAELQSSIPQEGQFVLERIRGILENFHSQTDEKQNLLCTDSSDPKVTLEIGENPVASCQSYVLGSENACLLGYTDANSKILVLRNERGNIVARSIFRLLSTEDGNPGLLIERIYSSVAGQGVTRALYTHALRKAQEIGIPLFVSSLSQDEQGNEADIVTPEGFTLVTQDITLRSEASRAPFVYVDSAGGRRSWGQYVVENLLEIKE